MGCLNNNRSVLSKTYAWRPLACLPIYKQSACDHADNADWLRHRRLDMFHRSLDIVIDETNILCSKNMYLRFGDGLIRECLCFYHLLSLDGMEIAACLMSNTGQCPTCKVPNDKLDCLDEEFECRTSEELIGQVQAAREKYLDVHGEIKQGCKEQVYRI